MEMKEAIKLVEEYKQLEIIYIEIEHMINEKQFKIIGGDVQVDIHYNYHEFMVEFLDEYATLIVARMQEIKNLLGVV